MRSLAEVAETSPIDAESLLLEQICGQGWVRWLDVGFIEDLLPGSQEASKFITCISISGVFLSNLYLQIIRGDYNNSIREISIWYEVNYAARKANQVKQKHKQTTDRKT